MHLSALRRIAVLGLLTLSACVAEGPPKNATRGTVHPQAALAAAIDKALTAACPPSATDDRIARDACAQALGEEPLFVESMAAQVFWGGAKTSDDYLEANRTVFGARVFRRMYLSTFMFPGGHEVYDLDEDTAVVRVPVIFRNAMDAGEFPYPFWHSADKWASYEQSTHVLFYVEDDTIVGGLRAPEKDPTRPHVERVWDAQWVWADDNGLQPRVALFSYVLSADNPHLEALDAAYRALEDEFRADRCLDCHSPDNASHMNPLWLLSYPNQALIARHTLKSVIANGYMPMDDQGIAIGLSDERREELAPLAEAFATIGDLALAHEGGE